MVKMANKASYWFRKAILKWILPDAESFCLCTSSIKTWSRWTEIWCTKSVNLPHLLSPGLLQHIISDICNKVLLSLRLPGPDYLIIALKVAECKRQWVDRLDSSVQSRLRNWRVVFQSVQTLKNLHHLKMMQNSAANFFKLASHWIIARKTFHCVSLNSEHLWPVSCEVAFSTICFWKWLFYVQSMQTEYTSVHIT